MNVGIATNPNKKDSKTLSKGMIVFNKYGNTRMVTDTTGYYIL